MKKLGLIGILFFIFVFSGCTRIVLDGSDKIESARKEFGGYNSGRILVQSKESETVTPVTELVYYYDSDDVLHYLRTDYFENGTRYQYNDGKELKVKDEGEIPVEAGTPEFKKYTRKKSYTYLKGEFMFYLPGFVSKTDVYEDSDGLTQIHYIYNVSKTFDKKTINRSDGSTLTGFETVYTFSKEGKFIEIAQTSTVLEENKESVVSSFIVKAEMLGEITEIDSSAVS